MLRCENITKVYIDRSTGENIRVLDNCSLSISPNEIVGLMGKSGCGKSTFARIILRLIPCDAGKIIFDERDVTRLGFKELKPFRRSVQLISQRPESFFDPIMTLEKSLREPLSIFGIDNAEESIEEMLELVKLNKSLLGRYPHQVSGGEIQRLSIARALLLNPKVLILDEPTSMLDISVQAQILHLLKDVQRERNLSYLLITHDSQVANWFCHRVVKMENGEILEK